MISWTMNTCKNCDGTIQALTNQRKKQWVHSGTMSSMCPSPGWAEPKF